MTKIERRGWFIVAVHFTTLFFVLGGGYDAQTVFVPELVKQFGWSRAQVGTLFMALSLAAGISAPLAGWLLDLVSAQFVVCAGAGIAGLGLAAASRASGYGEMVVAFLMLGVGMAASGYVPAAFVVSNWFNLARRGLAVGIAMAGETAGAMLMTLIVAYVIASKGWRAGYLALAIPTLLIVIPSVLCLVRTRPTIAGVDKGRTQEIAAGMNVSEAVHSRSFWLIAIAEFGGGFYVTAVWIHLAAYLRGIGYSLEVTAFAVSAAMALATAGQPIMGIIADRVTSRVALATAFVVNAISFILVLYAKHALYLALFIILFGSMLTAPVTLLALLTATSLGLRKYGSLSGIMFLFWVVGASFGPFVAGWIFDLSGSYSSAFLLCAGVSFLSGTASWLTISLPDEYRVDNLVVSGLHT